VNKLVRVVKVTPLEDYHCRLVFEDGTEKVVKLYPYLRGPIFEPMLKNIDTFRRVRVVDGTVGWDNGADIDPDVLYHDLKPAWMEEPINR
jgi:Protein of unknown function (DUF2442)